MEWCRDRERRSRDRETWPCHFSRIADERPKSAKTFGVLARLLAPADVDVNGSRPWDIRIHDPGPQMRLAQGSLGLGESYMDGWWDCESLDEFFCRVLRARLDEAVATTLVLYSLRAGSSTCRARTAHGRSGVPTTISATSSSPRCWTAP